MVPNGGFSPLSASGFLIQDSVALVCLELRLEHGGLPVDLMCHHSKHVS